MNDARKSILNLLVMVGGKIIRPSEMRAEILNVEKFLDTLPAQQVEVGKQFAARLAAETALARANLTIAELREQLAQRTCTVHLNYTPPTENEMEAIVADLRSAITQGVK